MNFGQMPTLASVQRNDKKRRAVNELSLKKNPDSTSEDGSRSEERDINESNINGRRIEIPKPVDIERRLHESIIGQEKAVENFAKLKKFIESGFRPEKGPIDAEWLSGPSGVGKTEMVKKIIDLMLEDHPQYNENNQLMEKVNPADYMIRIDGGSYQDKHEIAKVLGAPPGYVGGDIDPMFSQENIEKNSIHYKDRQGKERKVCFILIDEADKAHQDLFRALLAPLDDGILTLGNNERVDLSNCVFLFTSNLGNKEVIDAQKNGDERVSEEIYQEAYKEHFPPEFLGRIKKMTIFEHLSRAEIKQIVSLQFKKVETMFSSKGINFNLDITDKAIDWLIKEGYSKSEGARAMQKLINKEIQESLIAINGEYVLNGKSIAVDVSSDKEELEFILLDDDIEYNFEIDRKINFYKKIIGGKVAESLNADSIIRIDTFSDLLIKGLIKRDKISANTIMESYLRKRYNPFRSSSINNAEELSVYLKDVLEHEFNTKP